MRLSSLSSFARDCNCKIVCSRAGWKHTSLLARGKQVESIHSIHMKTLMVTIQFLKLAKSERKLTKKLALEV